MRNFCHLLLGWQRFVFAQSSLSRGTFSLEWLLSPIVTGIKNRNNFATTKPPTYNTSWGWCAEWWWHQWMGNRTELSPIISDPSLTKALLHRTMLHSWSIYSYQLTTYICNFYVDIDDFDIWHNVLYVSQVVLHYFLSTTKQVLFFCVLRTSLICSTVCKRKT